MKTDVTGVIIYLLSGKTYGNDYDRAGLDLEGKIKEGLKRTGGYCPCKLGRTEDYKCMCLEFRNQIADPDFEGYCHCMLYYKEK